MNIRLFGLFGYLPNIIIPMDKGTKYLPHTYICIVCAFANYLF